MAAAHKWLLSPVLSEAGRRHVANHKYKAGKATLLDELLNPSWVGLTELLPRWLAPNLVTFAGFLPLLMSYVLAWLFSPDMATPVPRWVSGFAGLALLFYQTFDAMDGKQARRIGESSPLGQLFDHGCDCLACLSHHSMATLVLLPGSSHWSLLGLAMLQTGFFLAQWQEHYTGVLYTSFGFCGVTETQFMLISLLLLATIAGPEATGEFASTVILLPTAAGDVTAGVLMVLAWTAFCGLMMLVCLVNTFRLAPTALKEVPGSEGPGPQRVLQAALDLAPIVVLNVLLFSWPHWVVVQPLRCRLLCLCTGLLFFYYTAQMILFTMSRMPFPMWQPTLVPYVLLVLIARVAPSEGDGASWLQLLLPAYALGMGLLVLLWVHNVIQELKEQLGINVFTVTSKAKK